MWCLEEVDQTWRSVAQHVLPLIGHVYARWVVESYPDFEKEPEKYPEYEAYSQYLTLPEGHSVMQEFYITVTVQKDGVWKDIQSIFAMLISDTSGIPILAFRGTEAAYEWLLDLAAFQVPHPQGGCVHAGFEFLALELWRPIKKAVEGVSRLLIAGHSLGGAVATILAPALALRVSVLSVFTFGSPRVGNPEFAQMYNQRIGAHHRVEILLDPAPFMPPTSINTTTTGYLYNHVEKGITLWPSVATLLDSVNPLQYHLLATYVKLVNDVSVNSKQDLPRVPQGLPRQKFPPPNYVEGYRGQPGAFILPNGTQIPLSALVESPLIN